MTELCPFKLVLDQAHTYQFLIFKTSAKTCGGGAGSKELKTPTNQQQKTKTNKQKQTKKPNQTPHNHQNPRQTLNIYSPPLGFQPSPLF